MGGGVAVGGFERSSQITDSIRTIFLRYGSFQRKIFNCESICTNWERNQEHSFGSCLIAYLLFGDPLRLSYKKKAFYSPSCCGRSRYPNSSVSNRRWSRTILPCPRWPTLHPLLRVSTLVPTVTKRTSDPDCNCWLYPSLARPTRSAPSKPCPPNRPSPRTEQLDQQ